MVDQSKVQSKARTEDPTVNLQYAIASSNLLRLDSGVYILTFTGEPHHRFDPEAICVINNSLDQVLNDSSACALITTNLGKFYSNGVDINYLKNLDMEGAKEYLLALQRLISKILTFCIPTVAIIRGHAVGAGCLFALAHDYRIMSLNHGFIFMNEVNIGMSLTPGNMAVLRSKLPTLTFSDVILTGKRYDGKSAVTAGIVHATYTSGPILLAKHLSSNQEAGTAKYIMLSEQMEMFKDALRELETGGFGFARM